MTYPSHSLLYLRRGITRFVVNQTTLRADSPMTEIQVKDES